MYVVIVYRGKLPVPTVYKVFGTWETMLDADKWGNANLAGEIWEAHRVTIAASTL